MLIPVNNIDTHSDLDVIGESEIGNNDSKLERPRKKRGNIPL
jgi:hypothetical protein